MLKDHWQLRAAVSLAAILIPAYAQAQDAQSDRLQRQLDALQKQVESQQKQVETQQKQVESLQKQLAESKKREAAQAQAPADAAYAADAKMPMKVKAPPAPGIKMIWGGFLAAESVYRQHNTVSDMGTPFTAIPYPFSPQYSEHEFRGSARQSRLSLLVEGSIDPTEKLAGYYEMDFLGTGITSNYNQSNSWDLRARRS
jgi:TolA-binding protein